MFSSYRNQLIDLQDKSVKLFLYNGIIGKKWFKIKCLERCSKTM